MGGKDTVLVDRDADLDLAASSIVYSAFGFSGKNVQPVPVRSFIRTSMMKLLKSRRFNKITHRRKSGRF